jgi:hypothetical protein
MDWLRRLFKPGDPEPLLLNDRLFWLKTRELEEPLRILTTDKELMKDYATTVECGAYNVPTLAIFRDPEAVEAFEFPPTCCIKPTHARGQVILRREGEPVDIARVKGWFALNQYNETREVNYRDLKPQVMVEALLSGGLDFKFFCVEGAAKLIQVDIDPLGERRRALFDLNWNQQPYSLEYPPPDMAPTKPANLRTMIEVAEMLAASFNFVRIDLYSNGADCHLLEISHCPGAGLERFIPRSAEREASKLLFG